MNSCNSSVAGKLLFASLILLLILAGCSMKKPVAVGCCVLDDPEAPFPQCMDLEGKDDNTDLLTSNSCNVTAGTCNVTIEVSLGDTTTTSELTVPICGEPVTPCISSDCIAQVCGSLTYNPTPLPTYRDAQNFEAEAEETGQIGAVEETKDRTPTGLHGATCSLQRSDESLTNYLKNSKGSFINTFRFGVGESFDEFDRYRWLFPTSDIYCNANPLAGGKDRYMNYLLSPDEFEDKMDGVSYDDPVEKVTSAGFCLESEESPFLGETYDGADSPGYRYYPIDRTRSPGSTLEVTALDKEFYSSFLTLIYGDELTSGLSSFATLPEPAPFECSSSIDCSSSYCNFQDYNRMLCKNTVSGEWVLCGCDESARRCSGQSTEFSYHNNDEPEDAADLLAHLQGYKNGERYYAVHQLPVGIVDIKVNPTCTAGNSIRGIDWISVQRRPPLDIMKFVDEGVATPSSDELTELEDCESSGDWEDCEDLIDDLFENMRADIILNGEIEATDKFPNDIVFFGSPEQGSIGYSLLSEPRFKQTDFYKACKPDYEIVNATKTYSGGPSDPLNPQTGGDHNNQAAKDAVRSAKLFIAPEPIPEYLGADWKPYDNKIQCHTDNDDEGYYRYVPIYILIKDTGVCEADPVTGVPKSVAFGWCEPCSYATMAKQEIETASQPYTPGQIIEYTSYSKTTSTSEPVCDPPTTPDEVFENFFSDGPDFFCRSTDDPENLDAGYFPGDFNATPDSIYLQEKQSQYLKENVMPIFDLLDESNWDSSNKLRLENTLIGRGPSILIVQNISTSQLIPVSILTRIDSAKAACPTCLIAVEFSNNGTPFSMDAGERMEENLKLADWLDPETTPGLLERLDIVAISFYANEYTDENPDSCDLDPTDLNEEVFYFLENESRSIMMKTKIPVLVNDFAMELDSCWNETEAKQFISYMFLKQKRLSRTGMAGIVFSNLSILTQPGGDHLPMFCALEKGSHNMAADEPATLFSRVYTSPAEQVLCSACSEFDIVSGLCDTTCINGVECTVNEEAIAMAKTQLGLPETTPDSQVPLKCSDQTLPEPCTPCSEMTEQIYCEFFRSDGSVLDATYNIADLTVLEGDIISSIPPPYACCVSDEAGNYTFVKQTSLGKITAPILYSPSGDPRQDCGVADVSAFEQPLCDVPLPIKNHKVECTIIP